jgi:hypothetical protein
VISGRSVRDGESYVDEKSLERLPAELVLARDIRSTPQQRTNVTVVECGTSAAACSKIGTRIPVGYDGKAAGGL